MEQALELPGSPPAAPTAANRAEWIAKLAAAATTTIAWDLPDRYAATNDAIRARWPGEAASVDAWAAIYLAITRWTDYGAGPEELTIATVDAGLVFVARRLRLGHFPSYAGIAMSEHLLSDRDPSHAGWAFHEQVAAEVTAMFRRRSA